MFLAGGELDAIATLLFDYASDEQFLDGIDAIDFFMLEFVTGMSSRCEVRVRTTREWERAILRSFEIWRGLRAARGGTVHVDLRRRAHRTQAQCGALARTRRRLDTVRESGSALAHHGDPGLGTTPMRSVGSMSNGEDLGCGFLQSTHDDTLAASSVRREGSE
jgi:hypothetical protein